MLIFVLVLEFLDLVLRATHVTHWNELAGLAPVLVGLPLWAVWTWLKVWAVGKSRGIDD